ncbi:MAG: hypothetical protein ABL899_02435 [Nitrospira sp.]
MFTPSMQRIYVTILSIATIGYFAYTVFLSPPDLTGIDLANSQTVGQDILVLVDKLNQTRMDQSIFTSPVFSSLKDNAVPILPEAKGRPNPFAPVGVDR